MGILEAHLNNLFCQNADFRFVRKGFKVNEALESGSNLPKYPDTNKSPSCRFIIPINTHRQGCIRYRVVLFIPIADTYFIFLQTNILNVIRYSKADLPLRRLIRAEVVIGGKEDSV